MNSEKLTAEELLKITSSQWATSKDIMIIGCVGRNKAYSIMQEISLEYYKDNKIRNKRLVPMSEVLKYFNIDLTYLKNVTGISNNG